VRSNLYVLKSAAVSKVATSSTALLRAGGEGGAIVAETVTNASIAQTGTREKQVERIVEARIKGYEGDACGECGNFTLVRNGTCLKCNTCGGTSGCS
jgi:ribonucleoside-diphosphate reductase alpha chain